ncbi:MAG: hypothetical protein HY900_22065 [Deltaproteobacteria bacterium]|nr:hypothetical protein [Deltaproteobacteria bacterium]
MRLRPLALLLLLLPVAAPAEELSGYTEAKGFAFARRGPEGEARLLGWTTLFVKAERRLGGARLAAALRAEDTSGGEVGSFAFDPADRHAKRPPLSARELWARVALAPSLDLQLGRFELGWGKTDGYSPADAFLPRDLSDPFADEKLPLWAARLTGQRGSLRLESVLCPVTTPWRLPRLGGRNAPLPRDSPVGPVTFRDEENAPPTAGFGALRALATFGEWDVGAWARYGVRPAPLLQFATQRAAVTPSGVLVPVERRYAREGAAGVEASRVLGPWVVRGEAAALVSDDGDLGNALIGTLGAERGFGDATLLLTLAGNARKTPGEAGFLFDRGILPAFIAAWNRAESWGSWKVVWTAALRHGDGLVKAEVGYELTELWKVTAGADVPYGSEEGPLGSLHAARRVRLAVRRAW